MDTIFLPAFLILGLLAGGLFASIVMRWVALLLASNAKLGGDFLGPPRRRTAWALPFVALLYPAPYIIFLVALLVVRQFHAATAPAWIWFLIGFAISVLFSGVRTASVMRRLRRKRTLPSQT